MPRPAARPVARGSFDRRTSVGNGRAIEHQVGLEPLQRLSAYAFDPQQIFDGAELGESLSQGEDRLGARGTYTREAWSARLRGHVEHHPTIG